MNSRLTDGVGKKIVDALKHQSDVEIKPFHEEEERVSTYSPAGNSEQFSSFDTSNTFPEIPTMNTEINNSSAESAFQNSMLNFQNVNPDLVKPDVIEDMELPANVNVLRQLITKIPAGVSKQTGAMIIKQTMEALGISMTNVLQEAQQVQEKLTQSVRECQTNVLEYKKQINLLEVQARKYQRQFAAINDIISLFIQTNN